MNTLKAESGTQAAVKERPILFSAPMVRALLDGRKTQTRRVVKVQPLMDTTDSCILTVDGWQYTYLTGKSGKTQLCANLPKPFKCPYGDVGDRLWVRENFARNIPGCEEQKGLSFQADHKDPRGDGPANPMRWTPSIHMPRWASRITLEITGVRVERVQNISEADAKAEGMVSQPVGKTHIYGLPERASHWQITAREAFFHLFYGINKRADQSANPWVWVVEFKRL